MPSSKFACLIGLALFPQRLEKASISFHGPKSETSVKSTKHSLVVINGQKLVEGQNLSPKVGDKSVICHQYSACQYFIEFLTQLKPMSFFELS